MIFYLGVAYLTTYGVMSWPAWVLLIFLLLIIVLSCIYWQTKHIGYLKHSVIILLFSLSAYCHSHWQQGYDLQRSHQAVWIRARITKAVHLAPQQQTYDAVVLPSHNAEGGQHLHLYHFGFAMIKHWPMSYDVKVKVTSSMTQGIQKAMVIKALPLKQHAFDIDSNINDEAQWIWAATGGYEAVAILIALLFGDRAYLSNRIWLVFAKTGTSHLLAIAGLHLGVMVLLSAWSMTWLWKRSSYRLKRCSAQALYAMTAALVACAYAWFTGFAIPCERAMIMLIVVSLVTLGFLHLTMIDRLCFAFMVIIFLFPYDIHAYGLYLSFFAVFNIIYGLQNSNDKQTYLKRWLHLNIIIYISLLPWSLYYFHQFSIIGMIANAIAIPWVTAVVLPAGIVCIAIWWFSKAAFLALWPKLLLLFNPLWHIIIWLAQWRYSTLYMKPSLLVMCLYGVGVLWLFAPKAVPGKVWAVVLLAPLLFGAHQKLPVVAHRKIFLQDKHRLVLLYNKDHLWVFGNGRDHLLQSQWGLKRIANLGVPWLDGHRLRYIQLLANAQQVPANTQVMPSRFYVAPGLVNFNPMLLS